MVGFPGTIRRKSPLTNPLVAPKKPKWVVSTIFYVQPYLEKIPSLTNIFQTGWKKNTQLVSQTIHCGHVTPRLSSLGGQCDKINMT